MYTIKFQNKSISDKIRDSGGAALIFHKTLVNIRKKHGLSQEELANIQGCKVEDIIAIESNKVQATYMFVTVLRNKLKLHDAPITENERTALMEELNNWKLAIDYDDMSKAAKLKPGLEKGARSSYSPSTEIFYDLYAASYYRATDDIKAHDETMAALEQRIEEFGPRHHFYYYRLLGARNFVAHRYKEALKAYRAAEKLDKDTRWGDVGLYYIIGVILSDMGYVTLAIEYLRKAMHLAKWHKVYYGKPNRRYDTQIDGFLAYNLSKMGKEDEAIVILDKRLSIEKERNSVDATIGYTYLSLGSVYLLNKKSSQAIVNFDTAFNYLDESSDVYKTNLYRKALALIESGAISDAVNCIDEGISISTDDELWSVLFKVLKCSVSLSDPKSLLYMIDIAIPKLQEYEQYEDVVGYYKLISDFYGKNKNHELSQKYSNFALETYEKLYKERIEGGL